MTEFKIRPITRYVLTKYKIDEPGEGSSSTIGEYSNPDVAYEVGTALAKAEQQHLGVNPFSNDVIYPEHPNHRIPASKPTLEAYADLYEEQCDTFRQINDALDRAGIAVETTYEAAIDELASRVVKA